MFNKKILLITLYSLPSPGLSLRCCPGRNERPSDLVLGRLLPPLAGLRGRALHPSILRDRGGVAKAEPGGQAAGWVGAGLRGLSEH